MVQTATSGGLPRPVAYTSHGDYDIYAIDYFSSETAGRWRSYGAFSVQKYSRMPVQIQLVDRYKGKSKSRSMEGFNMIALYNVDEFVVRGGD